MAGIWQANIREALVQIINNQGKIDAVAILENAKNIVLEKWEWTLPDTILRKSYVLLSLDFECAYRLVDRLMSDQKIWMQVVSVNMNALFLTYC